MKDAIFKNIDVQESHRSFKTSLQHEKSATFLGVVNNVATFSCRSDVLWYQQTYHSKQLPEDLSRYIDTIYPTALSIECKKKGDANAVAVFMGPGRQIPLKWIVSEYTA